MSERIPEDWSTIQIKELGPFYGGLTGKTAKDIGDGEPFLTYMQVFLQKTSDKEAVNSVQITKEENQNKVIYGDILFTTSSETPDEIGMSEVFLGTDWSPYLNSFCFGLRPEKPSPIYPLFAKYLFRGRKFRHDIRPLAQGSTRYNLSKENLGKLSLLIPPLQEQKKIASILTSVDEVIENTQLQINKLQDLKKGTMNELLTKGIGHTEFKDSELGQIPKSWKIMSLQKIAKDKKGAIKIGPFGSALSKNEMTSSGIKVYGQENIFNNDFCLGNYYIKEEKYKKLKTCRLYPGDVVISMMGTVGNCVIVPDNIELGIMDSHLLRIQIDESVACPNFVAMQLHESDNVKTQIYKMSQGGIMSGLNASIVKSILLPIPTCIHEQNKYLSIISSIDNNIKKMDLRLSQIQSLKKSLMQDLLTGKVRVTVN